MVEESSTTPFRPAEEMVINDLETLKVLADPLRLSILEYLMKPGTVKRIAEKINKPATKLYYHFNLLEKHELIQLVDTRVVSGIIEKHYQAAAKRYRLARGLLAPGGTELSEGLEITLSGILADTRNDIAQSIRDGVLAGSDAPDSELRLRFSQHRMFLTVEQIKELNQRLHDLMEAFQGPDATDPSVALSKDLHMYKMLVLSHPTSRVPLNDDEDDV